MVAARGGSRSVRLAPSLAFPRLPSGPPSPIAGVWRSVCEGGGGRRGGGGGRRGPRDGGRGRRRRRGTPRRHGRREAAGGAERWGSPRCRPRARAEAARASPPSPAPALCGLREWGEGSAWHRRGLVVWPRQRPPGLGRLAFTMLRLSLGKQQAREHCFPNLEPRGPGVLRTPALDVQEHLEDGSLVGWLGAGFIQIHAAAVGAPVGCRCSPAPLLGNTEGWSVRWSAPFRRLLTAGGKG